MRGARALGVAAALAALPVTHASYWAPDERVLVTDFSFVTAIAASSWYVYAATPNGLLIYDRSAKRWGLPVTALDGYPTSPVRAALADVVGNSVWLGTDDGWAHYDVDAHFWERGYAAGGVRSFAIDAQDPAGGVYMLTLSGWGYVPRGSSIPMPRPLPPGARLERPLDPRAALAEAPLAQAMSAQLLTDPRLRTYQFTSAARSSDRPDLFLGTNGDGIIRFDPTMGESEHLAFGLPSTAASAVAPAGDGVWTVGSARAGERRGLTWVATDLSETRVHEDALGRGTPAFTARRLVAAGEGFVLATDQGAWLIAHDGGSGRFYDIADGLPSGDVLALAPAPDGAWLGTARGLALLTNDGHVVRTGTFAGAVLALVAQNESLWVATPAGLGVLAPGAANPVVPPDVDSAPELSVGVVALARERDTIVAALADGRLAWRNPAGPRWTVVRPATDVGTVTALAGDAGGVWIGGTAGLAYWNIARGTWRTIRAPADVPGPVRDVVAQGDWIWVATDAGLVRFSRQAALHR